ncbi:hypothetical protein NADFUDRAFT_40765 [Nadsonia fulvescens var. elongata DSM 6958]|uniref:Uncharacterized protein n=1 Tax=Nadsonia fulvescens var. elongata DSM 6958 TaxID=857566 RepID=A0A1E3PS10_9ASCO|nr:hypothetical protein NADFUDRAFT_40765 [Nadsonia fulvescens var. elongata DSM 6958]
MHIFFYISFYEKILDSEILAELSKAFIGETPEEIQKYRDSFSNELKLLKSTDFDTLADFIVEFRSNYQLKINGRPGQTFSDRFLDWYKFDKIKKRSESKMSSQPNENA